MDCLRAQELISDALDHSPVDDSDLTEAKQHCRDCSDCAAFVRALLAVQKAPLPKPAEDLEDRVMARVRLEAEKAAIARARDTATPAQRAVDSAPSPAPAVTLTDLAARVRDPRRRASVIAWGSAAAVLFVAAAVGAFAGLRTILVPEPIAQYEFTGTTAEAPQADAPPTAPGAESGAAQDSARSLGAQEPRFITLDGSVYRFVSDVPTVNLENFERIDSVRTALDSGASPRTHDVYGSARGNLYVDARDRVMLFTWVTRDYRGDVYVLRSGDIDAFGEWPSLPSGVRRPGSADGSPVFDEEGTDAYGTKVYVERGRTAANGIAVGPNPPGGDPITGAPDWTWWEKDR